MIKKILKEWQWIIIKGKQRGKTIWVGIFEKKMQKKEESWMKKCKNSNARLGYILRRIIIIKIKIIIIKIIIIIIIRKKK